MCAHMTSIGKHLGLVESPRKITFLTLIREMLLSFMRFAMWVAPIETWRRRLIKELTLVKVKVLQVGVKW